jgi:transcriptional regulator with XRE-family HTH domain
MLFWERVKSLISEENITQSSIARSMHVRPDTFSRWIQRGTMPNASQAVFLAKSLNTTVEYLVTGTTYTKSHIRIRLDNFLDSLSENQIEQSFKMLKASFPRKASPSQVGLNIKCCISISRKNDGNTGTLI